MAVPQCETDLLRDVSELSIDAKLLDEDSEIPKDFEPGGSKHPIILSADPSSDLELQTDKEFDACERPSRPRSRTVVSERSTSQEDVQEMEEEFSCDSEQWRRQKKHVFVLSEAGKPIYCRHGCEEQLAALAGIMQALVSCVGLTGDQVRYLRAGDLRMAFLLRLPLILVAASNLPLSFQQLQSQLNYIHAQVLSVVTSTQLGRVFEQRRNFDLRRLLAGSERFLDSLCDLMDEDPSFLLGAVRCLPLAPSLREAITQAMLAQCSKQKKLAFGLLVAENQLVALVGLRRYQLHHMDLHLLLNLVHASESFKTAEAWTPVCLPKLDPSGFLHAHVSYLAEGCPACLLLLSVDRDMFFPLQECRRNIAQRLQGSLEALTVAVSKGYSVAEAGIPGLYHFAYKTGNHLSSPRVEAPCRPERLAAQYQMLHHRMYQPACPLKILFWASDTETLLGWHMAGFELYAAFEPLVSKDMAVRAMSKLVHWIKREEDRLFIMSYATL